MERVAGEFAEQTLHRLGVFVELGRRARRSSRPARRKAARSLRGTCQGSRCRPRLAYRRRDESLRRDAGREAFAIQDQLDAGIAKFGVEAAEALARHYDRNRDVVFDLHFVGRVKVRPQLVDAPRAVFVITDAQVIVDQLLVVELQLVAPDAVHAIDREVLAPVIAPLRPVVALHGEQTARDRL